MQRDFLIPLILSLVLSACSASAAATPTPTPSLTTESTKTPTLQPTPTTAPTSTPSPLFIPGGIESLVTSEGFTISVPFPLIHQADKHVVLVADEEKTFNASFAGDQYDGVQPLAEVIDSYLSSLEGRGWQFTKGETVDVQVNGVTGIAVDLTGTANNIAFEGQAAAASPRPDFVLFGIAIARVDDNPDNWKNKGQPAFEGLLDRIKFTDTNAACPVSTDRTYGYTEGNPIQIGGDVFNGPSRERAYLDHLKGPNGEPLSYEREGSIPTDTTILDGYKITGAGLNVTLYLDIYNYTPPQAPVGFTCNGAFPLPAP